MRISWGVILTTTITTALFFFFLIGLAVKGQKVRVQTGEEGIIGEIGEALASLQPSGMVRVHGELWKAESVSGTIDSGQKVKVTAINNLTLYVKHVDTNANPI